MVVSDLLRLLRNIKKKKEVFDVLRGLMTADYRQKRTLHGEVGGSGGGVQQAIARHAGVVPRILRDETGDEQSPVYHDLHP